MDTPARSSPADRNRPTLWDGAVILLIVLTAAGLFFLLLPQEGNFLTATVVLDGELVAEYRLDNPGGPLELALHNAPWPITLEIGPEGVQVLESACPGQDCVHAGRISRAGGRIICLPNRLVVSLTGSGGSGGEVDAVTG